MVELTDWVGRQESAADSAAAAPVAGLAATLDHPDPPWRVGEVPPLGHWLYFLPRAPQRDIAEDGHPRKGGFLPPVALPRRMWAGSRVTFHAPIPLGAALSRHSTIAAVEQKHGRTGALAFVTVRHEIHAGAALCVTDVHDIVYREAASPAAPPKPPSTRPAAFSRVVHPDPVLLFRYSALTFNGHRIHYDRDYCRDVEAYPGLVVHGPLTATLLMDLFLRENPGATVTGFAFRGQRPLFDTASFTLCGALTETGADLWALTPDGDIAMSATLAAQ